MALECGNCGAVNPATNRYCGQCGRRMERSASETPKEFWPGVGDKHPVEPAKASAELPPDVIDFDKQIPLVAAQGTDRRLQIPPELVEQVHDYLEPEAELHAQLQDGNKAHSEVSAEEQTKSELLRAGRSEYLRWDANDGTNGSNQETSDKPIGNAPVNASAEAGAAQVAHQNFIAEGERTAGTGVSGPSFLGLTDDRAPEYDDEEAEPDSHLRRNIALAVLVAAMILAAVQWRSIRNYGLAYVQNGSMQVKQSAKGAPQNPPTVAADNTSRDLGVSPATAKSGEPRAVESSPNADRGLPVQQAATAPQPPQTDSPAAGGTKKTAAVSNAISTPISTPVAAVPRSEPPAAVSRSAAKPRPFRAPPPARSASRAVPVSGVDEMKRAASASDAEARAAWLWKAVGKGNPQAPIELAKMYEQGRGVVRSCDQAVVLLRSAAAKGNQQARIDLQQIRSRGGCSARSPISRFRH